jgi:hypothetical protein
MEHIVITRRKLLYIALSAFACGAGIGMALMIATPRCISDVIAGTALFAVCVLAVLKMAAVEIPSAGRGNS